MRHQDMSGKTAIRRDAEMMMRRAHVLFARPAGGACPTANPRINRNVAADARALRALPRRFDHAGDLVAQREWQSAVFGDVEPLVTAQREITVLHVQIRVTDAA